MRIPKYVLRNMGLRTTREFKNLKRLQVKETIETWEKFIAGCAYVPGFTQNVREITKNLTDLKEKLSIKNWGR